MLGALLALMATQARTQPQPPCALLLHGLARSAGAMQTLAEALSQAGYHVVNHDYPSTREPIEILAARELPIALAQCGQTPRVDVVTHSMGGILLRQYLHQQAIPSLGRVVMLGPPNQGSEVVDALKGLAPFRWINGPAGAQLGTDAASVPRNLPAVDFELGIIAGTRTFNPFLSLLLPNPDDGKVSLANTKVEGMRAHIALPVTHTFMMKNAEVIAQTLHFLREGRFQSPRPDPSE